MKKKKIKSYDGKALQCFIFECEKPKAIVQIAHGMQEYSNNYFEFCQFLCDHGYLVFIFDERAHGHTAGFQNVGRVEEGDVFFQTVCDHLFFSKKLKKDYSNQNENLKLYFFSHSYGSFIGQSYLQQNPCCDKAVLMGSCYMKKPIVRIGKAVANLTCFFKGKDAEAKMIENLSFNTYKKKFKTGSWITTSDEETKKFYLDEFNGTPFSAGFYKFLFKNQLKLYKNLDLIDKNLPILIISGKDDVIGDMGKGTKKLYDVYIKHGLSARLKLYENKRHALLIEQNKAEIFKFLLDFFDEN